MGWEGRSQRRVLASCGSRELRTNGKPPAPPARLVEKGPGFRRGVLWVRCHQKNRKSGKPHHWAPLAQCSSAIHRPSSATPDARLAVEAQRLVSPPASCRAYYLQPTAPTAPTGADGPRCSRHSHIGSSPDACSPPAYIVYTYIRPAAYRTYGKSLSS